MMHLQQQQKRIDEGNAAHRSVPRAKVFSTVGKPLITSFNSGVPQHVVQKLLGHASPHMTAHYANSRVLHQPGEKPQVTWSAQDGSRRRHAIGAAS
jgi:integrase